MRLQSIEVFHAVLTTGTLTAAAKLMGVSQEAASKALQLAEDRLGFALFSRVRGRLQPTQQALLLRDRIEKIIHDVRELQRLTTSMGLPGSRPLQVTCTPTLALALLPDAIMQLREVFPDAAAELRTQHSAAMCESLNLRETDIGLTLQNTDKYNLLHQVLCRGCVMAIAPPGWWPRAEADQPLPIEELAGQPLIGITVRDALGSMLQSHLNQLNPTPCVRVWVQTYQLAYALVSKGKGLALVDPFTAHSMESGKVQVRPLKPQIEVVLRALHRSDSPLNPVQKHFLDLVTQLAQRMVALPDRTVRTMLRN